MSIAGALETILRNTKTIVTAFRSSELLLTLPRQLAESGAVTVVTSYPERQSFLSVLNPTIPVVLDTGLVWATAGPWVIFDTFVGVGKTMRGLLREPPETVRVVVVGPVLSSALLPGAAIYHLRDRSFPVEVRSDAQTDLAGLIANLDITPGATVLVESEEPLSLDLPFTEFVPGAAVIPPPTPGLQRIIYAPGPVLDLLPVSQVLTVISRPWSQGLADVHARLAGNQPGGLVYRRYTTSFFHQLPLIHVERPRSSEFYALLRIHQGLPAEVDPRLLTDDGRLNAAGQLALTGDLGGRWAQVITSTAHPYSAVVLAALMEVGPLFRPFASDNREEDETLKLRELFQTPDDVGVLFRVWQYAAEGSAYLVPGVMARVTARVAQLCRLLQLSPETELVVPRADLQRIFADQHVKKIGKPQLYRNEITDQLYEYDTSLPLSELKQNPPTSLLVLQTEPASRRFSDNKIILYAMEAPFEE